MGTIIVIALVALSVLHVAGMFGFPEHEYFETDDTWRRPVSVQF